MNTVLDMANIGSNKDKEVHNCNSSKPPYCGDIDDIKFIRTLISVRDTQDTLGEFKNVDSSFLLFDTTNGIQETYVWSIKCLLFSIFWLLLVFPALSTNWLFMLPSICTNIIVIIYATYGTLTKEFDSTNYSQFIDEKLDISISDHGFFVPKYFGWCIGPLFVYINVIIISIMYSDDNLSWIDQCVGEDYLSTRYIENGICLGRHIMMEMMIIHFAVTITISFGILRKPRKNITEIADIVKFDIANRYKDHKFEIDTFYKLVDEASISQTNIYMKAVALIVSLFISLGALYAGDNELFWDCKNVGIFIFYFCIVFYCTIVMFGLTQCSRFKTALNVDCIAMNILSRPIYITKIQDIGYWWEMRQYHHYYTTPLNGIQRASLLAGGLVLAVIGLLGLIGYMVVIIYEGDPKFVTSNPDGMVLMGATAGITLYVFELLNIAYTTSVYQLKHIQMLKYERLRIDNLIYLIDRRINFLENEEDFGNINEDENKQRKIILKNSKIEFKQCQNIISSFITYLKEYDVNPKILGIPITKSIMISIITYTIGILVTITATAFSSG